MRDSFKPRQYSTLFKKQYLLTPRKNTYAITQENSIYQTQNSFTMQNSVELKKRGSQKSQPHLSHFKTFQNSPTKLQNDVFLQDKNNLITDREERFRKQSLKKISIRRFQQRKPTDQSSCLSSKRRTINQRYSNIITQRRFKTKQSLNSQFLKLKKQQLKFQAMSRMPTFQSRKSRKSILSYLCYGFEGYFAKIRVVDLDQALKQLKKLKQQVTQILFQKKTCVRVQSLQFGKQFINNFSKLCYYLSVYLIVRKYDLKESILSISKDIEYFARRIQFFGVVLNICFKMGQQQSLKNDFTQAKYYFTKSLNLAVFLNDKYSEQLAIDKLGMCQYYLGNISGADHLHRNQAKLPIFEYQLIKEQYDNQKQIIKLFDERKQNARVEQDQQVAFGHQVINFETKCNSNYPLSNRYDALKDIQNMAHSRQFQSKVKLIKDKMNKTMQIGKKKYFGKLFTPKASKYRVENGFNNQIILTHRSLNRVQNDYQQKIIVKQGKYFSQLLKWLVQDCLPSVLNQKQAHQNFDC